MFVICGLKQVPHAWFHRFNSFLMSHDFVCSMADLSVFVYYPCSHTLVLLLCVYDSIPIGGTTSMLHSFIDNLYRPLVVKDLSDLHYFLGL